MIRFLCPNCQAVMECPERKGGSKIACLKCGQRLEIPRPAGINRTVLAPLAPARVQPPPPPQAGPPIVTPQAKRPRRRLLLWAGACALLLAASAVAIYAGGRAAVRAVAAPAGSRAEVRSDARTDEEELVRQFIVRRDERGGEVRFTRFGPHMTYAEITALAEEAGVPARKDETPCAVVRACWEGGAGDAVWFYTQPDLFAGERTKKEAPKGPRRFDHLFLVQGKTVKPLNLAARTPLGPFPEGGHCLTWLFHDSSPGDGWKDDFRAAMALAYPGVRPK